MTKIILVRHCQAEGNEKRFFQGRINTEITEKGKRQIEATVNKLKDEPIDVVYSSPLKRAFVTAKSIAESHNIPEDKIILDDDLMEINAGIWDGMYIKDIVRLFLNRAITGIITQNALIPKKRGNGKRLSACWQNVEKAY